MLHQTPTFAAHPRALHVRLLRNYLAVLPHTCRTPEGHTEDVTPGQEMGINVRSTVHEYGGGEYIAGDGIVYFSNFKCGWVQIQSVSLCSKQHAYDAVNADPKQLADPIMLHERHPSLLQG